MNILPFTLFFVLAIFAYVNSFMHRSQSTIYQAKLYVGSQKAYELAQNRFHKLLYKSLGTPPHKKNNKLPSKPKANRSKQKTSHPRETRKETSLAKFNLYPLISAENPKNTVGYICALNLLKRLYSRRNLEFEFIAQNFLDGLLKRARLYVKTHNQVPAITDLTPNFDKDSIDYKNFYKLLFGTKKYDLEMLGIPPLGDYFTFIEEIKHQCVHFYFAKIPVLQALWGDQVAELIVRAEGEKALKYNTKFQKMLAEKELQELISPVSDPAILQNWKEIISFQKYFKTISLYQSVEGIDAETSIKVRKRS